MTEKRMQKPNAKTDKDVTEIEDNLKEYDDYIQITLTDELRDDVLNFQKERSQKSLMPPPKSYTSLYFKNHTLKRSKCFKTTSCKNTGKGKKYSTKLFKVTGTPNQKSSIKTCTNPVKKEDNLKEYDDYIQITLTDELRDEVVNFEKKHSSEKSLISSKPRTASNISKLTLESYKKNDNNIKTIDMQKKQSFYSIQTYLFDTKQDFKKEKYHTNVDEHTYEEKKYILQEISLLEPIISAHTKYTSSTLKNSELKHCQPYMIERQNKQPLADSMKKETISKKFNDEMKMNQVLEEQNKIP